MLWILHTKAEEKKKIAALLNPYQMYDLCFCGVLNKVLPLCVGENPNVLCCILTAEYFIHPALLFDWFGIKFRHCERKRCFIFS